MSVSRLANNLPFSIPQNRSPTRTFSSLALAFRFWVSWSELRVPCLSLAVLAYSFPELMKLKQFADSGHSHRARQSKRWFRLGPKLLVAEIRNHNRFRIKVGCGGRFEFSKPRNCAILCAVVVVGSVMLIWLRVRIIEFVVAVKVQSLRAEIRIGKVRKKEESSRVCSKFCWKFVKCFEQRSERASDRRVLFRCDLVLLAAAELRVSACVCVCVPVSETWCIPVD